MKYLLFILTLLTASIASADVYKTIGNPATGKPDYVTIICPTTLPSNYTGFYCNGSQICIYFNGTSQECWPSVVVVSKMLLEDSTLALLEDGTNILLE